VPMGTPVTYQTDYRLHEPRSLCDRIELTIGECRRKCRPLEFLQSCAFKCVLCVCAVLALLIFGAVSFVSGQTRCHPRRLEGQQVPFSGAVLPDHVWLEPRDTWFGFSQQLDVWASDGSATSLGPKIGHFYDVRIPFVYFSLAYQDLDGRVWFHAQTPGLLRRYSWFGDEYEVERCGDSASSNVTTTLRVQQSLWEGSWFCITSCRRVYYLKRAKDDRVARVAFDSALTWVFGQTRHQWSMSMSPPADRGTVIASARSHVFPAPACLALGKSICRNTQGRAFRLLSRWNVDVGATSLAVPHWAAAFMTALEEMEGQDEETDVDDRTPDQPARTQ